MKRTVLIAVIALGVLPLTGCQLLLLPFLGIIFGPGCTDQEVAVPDGTPNTQHFAGTYTPDGSSSGSAIALDLSAALVDTDTYDVTGSATLAGTDYTVDGEVLAGTCETFVAEGLEPQRSPPARRTLALHLTETGASEAAYTIVAVGSTTDGPAYLATGTVSFDYPLFAAPSLGDAQAGTLDFTPLPY